MKLNDAALLKDKCLVNGQWVSAASGAVIDVFNPATGEKIASVPSLSAEETEGAIRHAEGALAEWRARSGKQRAAVLMAWFRLMQDNSEDLARIMTAEQGKPLAEARGEIAFAASFLEWFSEEAKRVYGDTIPAPTSDKRIIVIKQPVGVTAAITPWNFPSAMITRKAAPALAAGCPMIVRPAELTPLSALALGELALRAGVPAGVFQVITGDAEIQGRVLTGSPVVRKLSFTGSTRVGRLLMEQCAPTIKRISLELGGNAPFIVFEDADLDAAVSGALTAKFRNSGQTCVCANRILVHDRVYDAFAAKFAQAVGKLKIGNGLEPGVDIGPLINEQALQKVSDHIGDALGKGARLAVGGSVTGGLFMEPAVVTDVDETMAVAQEETFGPLAPLFRFHTEEEAIRIANSTIYGLAAYFYTRDFDRVVRVSEALEFGMVGHNTGLMSNEVSPFGGVKQSGIGREGSKYGIDEYLDIKFVCSQVNG